jgi:hypothetical protein
MNNFEPKSTEQLKEFFDGLRTKSVDELIALFGAPARELGPFQRERVHWDGKTDVVEYCRALGFLGMGTTAHILWVYERSDRQLEFFYTLDLDADPCAKHDQHTHVASYEGSTGKS